VAGGLDGKLPPSDLGSVYRNLDTLEQTGLVQHVHLGHGPGLYALVGRHRGWAVCDACCLNLFDRTPYAEIGASGAVLYAEYHRTLGDHVAELVAAGFVLDRLVEPEWPAGHDRTWGGWGPVRGALLPGTAIFVAHLGR